MENDIFCHMVKITYKNANQQLSKMLFLMGVLGVGQDAFDGAKKVRELV